MNPYFPLLAKVVLSLGISLAVLRFLAIPLVRVLTRICPDEDAATFWLSYTKAMLTIAPLLGVLVIDMATSFAAPADGLRVALIASLAGVLLGLHIVGKRLGRFVVVPQQRRELS